ncbi:MAG: peptidylprolyl isomerase [Rhodocyclaceae bacterium]|nr:peptidylprolyl isomerase [Rhodocyclaceae bacterium]
MKRILAPLSLVSLITLASPVAYADSVLAKVNGKPIPASRAQVILANQLAQGQTKTPELEAAIKEELVRREVLAQEATKKGFDKKPDVQAQMDLARQGVLISAYLNDYARNLKISDEDVKKEYDAIKAALGEKEYKARHILVETEGEAKDVIAKLKSGAKFEELAKASKDPGSKERGGDLGWANKASFVQPFAEAMVRLEKGKFTEVPVQTNFGWHVIQLDDVRELKAPALDEVKPQIVQRLRNMAVEKHIAELRNKAKID